MAMTDMNTRQNNHIDVDSERDGIALSGRLWEIMENAIALGDLYMIQRMEQVSSHPRDMSRCMFLSIEAHNADIWDFFAQKSQYDADMMGHSLDWAACNNFHSVIPSIAKHISDQRMFLSAMLAAIEYEHSESIALLFPYLDNATMVAALDHSSTMRLKNGFHQLQALHSARSLNQLGLIVCGQGQDAAPKKM